MSPTEWEAIDRVAAAKGLRWSKWALHVLKKKPEEMAAASYLRCAAQISLYRLAGRKSPLTYSEERLRKALDVVREQDSEAALLERMNFQVDENDPMLENSALFGEGDYKLIMGSDFEQVRSVYEAGGYILHIGTHRDGNRALVIEDKINGQHIALGFPFSAEQWEAATLKQHDALAKIHAHLSFE